MRTLGSKSSKITSQKKVGDDLIYHISFLFLRDKIINVIYMVIIVPIKKEKGLITEFKKLPYEQRSLARDLM